MCISKLSDKRYVVAYRYISRCNYLKAHLLCDVRVRAWGEGNACVARSWLHSSSPSSIGVSWKIPSDGVVNPVKSHRSVHDGDSQDERWNARAGL